MIECPKCESMEISDPVYRPQQVYESESLIYTCRRCGYSEARPTRDQQKAARLQPTTPEEP